VIWFSRYPGSYCEACSSDTKCSDYNNEYACSYDTCSAASTIFGCYWDDTEKNCSDITPKCLPGTTLCSDGFCREECDKPATCIGNPDGICEYGEGCSCEDCENRQDSCVENAICSNLLCMCEEGTSLCEDGTCDETCEENGGKAGCIGEPNGICEDRRGLCMLMIVYYLNRTAVQMDLVCDPDNFIML
jgi:hypothetical protein